MNARALVLGALLIAPSSLQAQQLDLATGAWVRVRARTLSSQHEAQVARLSTDSISLALDIGGPPLPLAILDVSFLEVRRERPHAKRRAITGMTVGAVLGAGAGALGAFLIAGSCNTSTTVGGAGGCGDAHVVEAALGGAAGGAVIGVFLGSIASSRVRWEVVINR